MGLFRDSRDRRDLSLKVCWTLAVWLMTQQLGCDVNEADEAEQRRLERHPPDNFGAREFCRAIPPQSKLLPALAVCIWATLELLERYDENAILSEKSGQHREKGDQRRETLLNPQTRCNGPGYCLLVVSMAKRSMALLLYAASASAGAPSTPAIACGTLHLTGRLRRASSLAPAVALEPVHGGGLPSQG